MVTIKTGDGLIEIRHGKEPDVACEIEYSDEGCGLMLYLTQEQVKEIREGLEPFEVK